mmetsp:Transcript_20142/g.67659  ORF Transcript_20142/g.67659 Transcript_20142/m.67659 type:complete len:179 (+) Transcript_20142:138-674(+)
MVTCYPGGGARYVRHCDNACDAGEGARCNGRRLTAILYLNGHWRTDHGGQLRIYAPGDAEGSEPVAEIAPVLDRLVLFLADRRCPHEVLPACADRYAVTAWFHDRDELQRAREGGTEAREVAETEREKIAREIERFEREFGRKATLAAALPAAADAEAADAEGGADRGAADSDDDPAA